MDNKKKQTGKIPRRDFCKQASLGLGASIFLTSLPSAGFANRVTGESKPKFPIRISGRYPHLTMFNPVDERECGIGGVVPWAGRLWVTTYFIGGVYGHDSGEGLYEITPDLSIIKRKESLGGCTANRMIHRESNQLFMGPYAIDENRNVRPISYKRMPGRLTANARHLTQPESKIYYLTMSEGIYEVDVNTLEVRMLFRDQASLTRGVYAGSGNGELLPGEHGKGAYTGQGRLVYANNGRGAFNAYQVHGHLTSPTGCLASWDGKSEHWQVVETSQFMEVTGPGGIHGNDSQTAPLWSTGWDHRSLILKLLDDGEWSTFRLPKADPSYDGLGGSHTEWFRIRQIGPEGQYLMDHHGMWLEFPGDFSKSVHRAPVPIANHLKITPDFAHWRDELVFGCYEVFKGGGLPESWGPWEGLVGRAYSNLWFSKWDELKNCGRPYGFGGPWVNDRVIAGKASDPYGFKGFTNRQLHLSHKNNHPISFDLEIDRTGRGDWKNFTTITVPAFGYIWHAFPDTLEAEWIRLIPDKDGQFVSAYFHYGSGGGAIIEHDMFNALAPADSETVRSGGRIRTGESGELQFAAWSTDYTGKGGWAGYYEMGEEMQLRSVNNPEAQKRLKEEVERYIEISVDEASVIIRDQRGSAKQKGKPYRLPKGALPFDQGTQLGPPRILRGESYHKALVNVCGILFSLPHLNAGGVANIKPIATHDKQITDFCAWRGLLVLAGCRNDLNDGGEHFIKSEDGQVGLWLGDIDDLWKLGKPTGVGGPWRNSQVDAGFPSDPYLMAGFHKKTLDLSHDAGEPVTFVIEVDFAINVDPLADGYGRWHNFRTITVPPGQTQRLEFPDGFSANWVRLKANQSCEVSAIFTYT